MSTTASTLDKIAAARLLPDAGAAGAGRTVPAVHVPRYSGALTVAVLGLTDACVLVAAFFSSVRLWTLFRPTADPNLLVSYWPFLLVFMVVYMGAGLYRVAGLNPVEELRRSVSATSLALLIFTGSTFLLKEARWFPRGIPLLTWLLASIALPPVRSLTRKICGPRQWFGRSVVILGAGKAGETVLRALQDSPWLGLKPVAILDDDPEKLDDLRGERTGIPVRGGLALARLLATKAHLGYAVLAMPGLSRSRLLKTVETYGQVFDKLLLIPDLLGMASLCVQATDLGGMLGLEIRHNLLYWPARLVKRLLDLMVVAALAPILLPAFGVIACLIKLTSPGPVFYGHTRIGCGSRMFKAWKFRTMILNADDVLRRHLLGNPALAEEWRLTHKLKDDPRVTRLGRFLRRSSLDELPQLINVLTGEMSLVGPRPIVAAEVEKYGETYAFYCRVKPGITGAWQVSGRNNTTYAQRVAFDQYYVLNWSVWLDLYILTRTVGTVLTGDGAY